jgi:hypothetical protein
MALTTCPDCKNEISTDAAACPRCGRPTKDATRGSPVLAWVLLVAFLGVGTWAAVSFTGRTSTTAPTSAPTSSTCFIYWPDERRPAAAATTSPIVLPTEQAALMFQSAIARGDKAAAADMLRLGRAVSPGARATVLERKPSMSRVLVEGAEAWALDDICHAVAPQPP